MVEDPASPAARVAAPVASSETFAAPSEALAAPGEALTDIELVTGEAALPAMTVAEVVVGIVVRLSVPAVFMMSHVVSCPLTAGSKWLRHWKT
jgi:hypothetical protein